MVEVSTEIRLLDEHHQSGPRLHRTCLLAEIPQRSRLTYGWHILDREVFLSLWIVIFAVMGCYLVGWLKFQSDETGGDINRPKPVPSIMLGLCSLAFAVYMVPGLWGAPCKAVSAFAPPMNTQDFNLSKDEVKAAFTNYDEGMELPARHISPCCLISQDLAV